MKKTKKEIKFAYESDYYFPGPKYAEKLITKEEIFCDKIRDLRWEDIYKQNRKFDLSNKENIEKLLKISEMTHEVYLEYVSKLRKVEADAGAWRLAEKYPDYCINAGLYCYLELPDGNDYYCRLINDYSSKDRKFYFDESMLNKKFATPIRGLIYHDISYPFYCMVEEDRLSFKEVLGLTKKNFYTKIKLELE